MRIPIAARRAIVIVVFVLLFALPVFFPEVINLSDAATICALTIVAMGQNVVTAVSGQMSLGQGAMAAFGAYGYAILIQAGVPVVAAFILAPIAAAIVGSLVALWAVRLSGVYLAMVTLAVVVAVPALAQWDALKDVTGGFQGISLPPVTTEVLGSTDFFVFIVCAAVALLAALFVHRLVRSRHGLALKVMGESELTAELSGVSVFRSRLMAFIISSVLAAVGGELLGIVNGIVSPDSYSLLFSVGFIVMIVLGGFGTSTGAFIGAIIVWELQTRLPSINLAPIGIPVDLVPSVVYGLLVMVFIVLIPDGIVGGVTRLFAWVTRSRRADRPAAAELEPVGESAIKL